MFACLSSSAGAVSGSCEASPGCCWKLPCWHVGDGSGGGTYVASDATYVPPPDRRRQSNKPPVSSRICPGVRTCRNCPCLSEVLMDAQKWRLSCCVGEDRVVFTTFCVPKYFGDHLPTWLSLPYRNYARFWRRMCFQAGSGRHVLSLRWPLSVFS